MPHLGLHTIGDTFPGALWAFRDKVIIVDSNDIPTGAFELEPIDLTGYTFELDFFATPPTADSIPLISYTLADGLSIADGSGQVLETCPCQSTTPNESPEYITLTPAGVPYVLQWAPGEFPPATLSPSLQPCELYFRLRTTDPDGFRLTREISGIVLTHEAQP